MCYHAEFSCSRSNRVRVTSGEPAKLGSARAKPPWDGWCVADRLKQTVPHMIIPRPI